MSRTRLPRSSLTAIRTEFRAARRRTRPRSGQGTVCDHPPVYIRRETAHGVVSRGLDRNETFGRIDPQFGTEADLKELQQRYAEVSELKNRQHELLAQLGQRLGAASEYLKALQAPDEGEGSDDATAGLVKALSGELEPRS